MCIRDRSLNEERVLVSDVGSMLGSSGEKTVLGILNQLDVGLYEIQDFHSKMKVDLTSCERVSGFIPENCAVLATGLYNEQVFVIRKLELPEIQPQHESYKLFASQDVFGAKSKLSRIFSKILTIEASLQKEDGFQKQTQQQLSLIHI
eukprot:TRINITY_DN16340_c0_g2_i1.p1 TRINITY_DN16340_c0_g2~~TRINITY_DN16340_c0_g2_i1.p1  ORF type:complete len:148 (+),score=6.04 TRINITY_DN16340_c0_g2_i1:69-512(+)